MRCILNCAAPSPRNKYMKSDLPIRKNPRLKNYDYSQNGCYFVTVCVKDKKPILGKIVGGDAQIDPKKIQLSKYGEIVAKYIQRINEVYDNISVEKYIVMPNHIHLLIFIDRWCGGAMWASPPTKALGTVIRSLKTMVTKEIGVFIWQRSYYDEIIKNESHFQGVWQYIEYNALKEYNERSE